MGSEIRSSGRIAARTSRPTIESDAHLERELLDDDPERRVIVRRELDHPDHERDADRIVDAGLALQNRGRPSSDLLVAKHGEHDRRVGGSDRGSEQACRDPVEAQDVVRDDGNDPGRCERPEHAEREDRHRRDPESAPADESPAVEEDDDQGDDGDPLDFKDRKALRELREDVGCDGGQEQEHRRLRHREALVQLRREQSEEQTACKDENDRPERCQFVHLLIPYKSLNEGTPRLAILTLCDCPGSSSHVAALRLARRGRRRVHGRPASG